MGRLNERALALLQRDFGRAAEAGHACEDIEHVRKGTSGSSYGYVATCSCGWKSSPRGSKTKAAAAGYWHVLEVCDALNERKRLDLVEWSAAPKSPALKSGVERARSRSSAAS